MKLAIIGAGPGGYVAAIRAAQLGAEVTVIEKDEVGGTCLNWGCIPTKALIASSEALYKAKNLESYGIEVSGQVTPRLDKIRERKDKIVSTQVKGIRALFKNWGITLVQGTGMLLTPEKIEVERRDGSTELLEADKIIVATGSKPAQLPLFPCDGAHVLSSDDAVRMEFIPKSLIIIGAGVIGCEFAFIYNALGTDVTMVEMMPRALVTEDQEIAEILERELKKKKIRLFTSAQVVSMEGSHSGIQVSLSDGKTLTAEKLLVSVGRSLNTDRIGLEALGIKKGTRGEILVNERMETNIPGVYAIGDVTGGLLYAHLASQEGIVAASNACGIEKKIDYSVIPAGIFTSPEIGSVGLRERQTEERGIPTKIGRFPFRGLGKAHAIGEITGLVKIIADAKTDKLLGVHIIGPHATDLVHEGALAMQAGLTAREIAETIHAHPTLSEALREAAEDLYGEAIHVMKDK